MRLINLDEAKANVREYYGNRRDASGRYILSLDSEWGREACAAVERGRAHALAQLAMGVDRPALVLDVDDTSLSTYEFMANTHFGRRQNREVLPAIEPVRSLAQELTTVGVALFFVTDRAPDRLADTLENLRLAGFPAPTELVVRPGGHATSAEFKAAARAHIASLGYQVILSLGDQPADCVDDAFRLPNPMYRIT